MDEEKKRKGETKASPLNGTAPRRMEDTTGREVTASRPEPTSLTLAQGLKAPVEAPGKEPGLSESTLPGTKAPVPEPGVARPNAQTGIQPGLSLVKKTGTMSNNIESSGGYSRIDAPTFAEFEKNNRPKLVDLLGWAPKTKEEVERDEKKARRRALISGIGDMMSALSSLYFTTKGAPNMYDHRNSMSEKPGRVTNGRKRNMTGIAANTSTPPWVCIVTSWTITDGTTIRISRSSRCSISWSVRRNRMRVPQNRQSAMKLYISSIY